MSAIGRLRKAIGYESVTPTCQNCDSFSLPYVYLTTNSIPKKSNPKCSRFEMAVARNGCCDYWKGSDGATVEDVEPAQEKKVSRLKQRIFKEAQQ